jgi:hypothetical protein
MGPQPVLPGRANQTLQLPKSPSPPMANDVGKLTEESAASLIKVNRAAKIIQDALGIESGDVANYPAMGGGARLYRS